MKHLTNMFLKTFLSAAVIAVCLAPLSSSAQDGPVFKAIDKYLSTVDTKKFYQIMPKEVNNQMKVRPNLVILDVRKPDEVKELGKIPGALHIRLNALAKNLDKLPKKDAAIIIYCKGGARGTMAAGFLGILGYTNAKNMKGGFAAWTKAGYKVKK